MVDQSSLSRAGASRRTALVAAASNAQEKAVAALLSLGADPLARTDDGSAAHASASGGRRAGRRPRSKRLLDHCRPARDALDARGRTCELVDACAHDRAMPPTSCSARAAVPPGAYTDKRTRARRLAAAAGAADAARACVEARRGDRGGRRRGRPPAPPGGERRARARLRAAARGGRAAARAQRRRRDAARARGLRRRRAAAGGGGATRRSGRGGGGAGGGGARQPRGRLHEFALDAPERLHQALQEDAAPSSSWPRRRPPAAVPRAALDRSLARARRHRARPRRTPTPPEAPPKTRRRTPRWRRGSQAGSLTSIEIAGSARRPRATPAAVHIICPPRRSPSVRSLL